MAACDTASLVTGSIEITGAIEDTGPTGPIGVTGPTGATCASSSGGASTRTLEIITVKYARDLFDTVVGAPFRTNIYGGCRTLAVSSAELPYTEGLKETCEALVAKFQEDLGTPFPNALQVINERIAPAKFEYRPVRPPWFQQLTAFMDAHGIDWTAYDHMKEDCCGNETWNGLLAEGYESVQVAEPLFGGPKWIRLELSIPVSHQGNLYLTHTRIAELVDRFSALKAAASQH